MTPYKSAQGHLPHITTPPPASSFNVRRRIFRFPIHQQIRVLHQSERCDEEGGACRRESEGNPEPETSPGYSPLSTSESTEVNFAFPKAAS